MSLRAGQWVEVKSAEEIFATLDERGSLENLPFMPEMLQYCGHRFQVYKSAHKTCDTIQTYTARRMRNTVHLAGLRCDGSAHDGCQAGCLMFWKEAWLKPVPGLHARIATAAPAAPARRAVADADVLRRETRSGEGYRCQSTELLKASAPLPWWDPRPYVRDLWTGNVGLWAFIRYVAIAAYNSLMRLHWRGRPYPSVRGTAKGPTPSEPLDLREGEFVRVRPQHEIMATLDDNRKNRGLTFDVEMVPYCGRTFRVLRKVEKMVDEKTGRMIRPPSPCLILEGVTCSGCLSHKRLFCPRAVYPFWHEIWLRRVESRRAGAVTAAGG